jgi:hypothetical protein
MSYSANRYKSKLDYIQQCLQARPPTGQEAGITPEQVNFLWLEFLEEIKAGHASREEWVNAYVADLRTFLQICKHQKYKKCLSLQTLTTLQGPMSDSFGRPPQSRSWRVSDGSFPMCPYHSGQLQTVSQVFSTSHKLESQNFSVSTIGRHCSGGVLCSASSAGTDSGSQLDM